MGNQPIIKVDNAVTVFESARGPVRAVDSFDLYVDTSGSIKIKDREVAAPRREVGMVFQSANLLPWRNLIQNIYFLFEILHEDQSAKHRSGSYQQLPHL